MLDSQEGLASFDGNRIKGPIVSRRAFVVLCKQLFCKRFFMTLEKKILSQNHNSIVVHNIQKSFGIHKVLQNISLRIPEKNSLVIMGQSGSGKSVLLKCLLGFLQADAGEVYIDGFPVHKENEEQREMRFHKSGVLFQSPALLDNLTVWENIAFRVLKKTSQEKARKIAMESLVSVGLSPKTAHLFPNELSGGMRRRVSLARAICERPTLLFFDEPTSGLDPIFSTMMSMLIRKCSQELGATTLTITHDIRCAQIIADEVALLHAGNIAWQGSPQELTSSSNPLVHQFALGETTGPMSSCL